jgi:hypothetical protein
MLLLGLGPTGGAAWMTDDALQEEQCISTEPNAVSVASEHGGFTTGICVVFLFAAVAWSFFLWHLFQVDSTDS